MEGIPVSWKYWDEFAQMYKKIHAGSIQHDGFFVAHKSFGNFRCKADELIRFEDSGGTRGYVW